MKRFKVTPNQSKDKEKATMMEVMLEHWANENQEMMYELLEVSNQLAFINAKWGTHFKIAPNLNEIIK
jgi:hypothetical protein